jgi:hypothetical protein
MRFVSKQMSKHLTQSCLLFSKEGCTALTLSCELNHSATAIMLIENGANIEAFDNVREFEGRKTTGATFLRLCD